MKLTKKHLTVLAVSLFFIFIFFSSVIPLRDYDIFFHLKSGEIIAQQGIIHKDVFSFSASNSEWYPYEWLFQVGVYYSNQIFGFNAISYLTAIFIAIQIGLIFLLLKNILKLGVVPSLLISFLFYASVYEFMAARPYIVAYPIFTANIYLILDYLLYNKNRLYLMVPLMFIWTNLHGSMFLGIALFGAYAGVSLLNFFLNKKKNELKKFWVLSLYTLIMGIITILPPLELTQWRLLVKFYQDRILLSHFIDEWTPLAYNPVGFAIFSATTAVVFILLFFVVFKRKLYREATWLLPLLVFAPLAYTASRNLYLAYITFVVLVGFAISKFNFKSFSRLQKGLVVLLIAALLGTHAWLLYIKKQPLMLYYPVSASQFILDQHLAGNMFNEYNYGGYLLYRLYPYQKVFIDGRTDVYIDNIIPDYQTLATQKDLPDDQYKKFLYDNFWNKFNISFVVLRTEQHEVMRKIARLLTDDPNWSLVFWDDNTEIFVRRDGKNDPVINEWGAKAATPYSTTLFRPNQMEQALQEYQRMIGYADSGRSRNAIGFINLNQGKFNEAALEFNRAIALNPNFESPYMNLAEISAKNGDLNTAIELYKKAQSLNPSRGLIYIRLGQLGLQDGWSIGQAKSVWSKGLKNAEDENDKKELQHLLEISQ